MTNHLRALFLCAIVALVGCGGANALQSPSVSAVPTVPTTSNQVSADARLRARHPSPSPSPTIAPSPGPSSSPVVLWSAGDPNLGNHWWYHDGSYGQCGYPNGNTIGGGPVASGSSFWFPVAQSGKTCYRNQVMPSPDSGQDNFYLTPGQVYSVSFTYTDGDANGNAPGMGYDADARSLIWQVHPDKGDPILALGFWNGGITGSPQQWRLSYNTSDGAAAWSGPYTPQETDTWKITFLVSNTSSGWVQLYRNGTLVYSGTGPTYAGTTAPWWNFGPYPWRWALSGAGGSTMLSKNATINGMTLTTP